MDVALNTFVAETIKEIIEGITTAGDDILNKYNKAESPNIAIGTDGFQKVEFDISVASSKTGEKSGGGGLSIKVLEIGAKMSDTLENSMVNKIKFAVTISVRYRKNNPESA